MHSTATAEQSSQRTALELSVHLSDAYLLYVKTQNFHWNVVDPRFHSLHEFFEKQYQELAEAIDVIAERIRANIGVSSSFFCGKQLYINRF